MFKKIRLMFFIMLVFYGLAIIMWRVTGTIFFLLNFGFIGTALGLGLGLFPILPKGKKHIARKLSQLLVGGYLFFGLGFGLVYIMFGAIVPENMQIEGFWFWLLSGAVAAGVIHYFVAKIFGPLIINRGWCGWACWTAAVLDLLPFTKSPGRLNQKFGNIRYLHFGLSAILVTILTFVFSYTLKSTVGVINLKNMANIPYHQYYKLWQIPEWWWFLIGNIIYFGFGIILAFTLKDNRAFCKYVCPITAFLKLGSRFSLVKIKGDKEKCNECGLCNKNCPMDIRITDYTQNDKRVTASECIICETCVSSCARNVLKLSIGFDAGFKEILRGKISQKGGEIK
jgi:ferredoxin-type protein NapH